MLSAVVAQSATALRMTRALFVGFDDQRAVAPESLPGRAADLLYRSRFRWATGYDRARAFGESASVADDCFGDPRAPSCDAHADRPSGRRRSTRRTPGRPRSRIRPSSSRSRVPRAQTVRRSDARRERPVGRPIPSSPSTTRHPAGGNRSPGWPVHTRCHAARPRRPTRSVTRRYRHRQLGRSARDPLRMSHRSGDPLRSSFFARRRALAINAGSGSIAVFAHPTP